MRTLILYYSYSGNTRKIAETIHKSIGGEIAEIETSIPYLGSYNAVVKQAKREIEGGFMPQLKPLKVSPNGYDTIILGTPVWWYTFAPAVKTFFSQYDLAGKTVCPFITDGGWSGHTAQDIEAACPGAMVKPAIDIRFDGSRMTTPAAELDAWIKEIR